VAHWVLEHCRSTVRSSPPAEQRHQISPPDLACVV
jgi:hypothetical protein